jgi:MFS family permease
MTTPITQTSQSEAQTYQYITRRIVPFLFICYLVAMIDRLNVSFAKLQFMADLHLSETQFGFAASLLYVGYILFEVPSNLMLQKSGIRLTLLRIMTTWGLMTVLLAFARNAGEFYVIRFLIGAAEAGFLPGVLLYLTYWYPDHMRGRITSLFVAAVPVSGILGGPLAGWIMTAGQPRQAGCLRRNASMWPGQSPRRRRCRRRIPAPFAARCATCACGDWRSPISSSIASRTPCWSGYRPCCEASAASA